MLPIHLSDEELSRVIAACAPLAREHRDGFLRAVAAELRNHPEPGPGDVDRAIRATQKLFFDPPLTIGREAVGKYAR